MVINDRSDIKQRVFTFKHSLNRGIHSSPSKICMWNSIVQALLTRIRFNKRMQDFQFRTKDFSIIWSINYDASVIGSNIQCDVMKQPGETVSAG